MSNVKSLDALDINGLAIFKENIVKKYVTQGEAQSVIGRAIYRALQQYKKDVVQFYSSYANLPRDGNSGTLYLIHKSMDSEHTDPNAKYKNKIWISAPTTRKKIICEFSSNYTINAYKNSEGYYVLDLTEVDANKVSYFRVYEATYMVLTNNLYVPGTTTTLTSYAQLSNLSGKIVAVPLVDWLSDTLVLPRFEYAKDLPAKYTVPDDEIWIYRDSTTLSYNVYNWGSGTINDKNEYGFFVLKKGVHFPTDGSVRIYPTYIAGSLYYCTREDGIVSLDTADNMFRMCGHIFALPPYGGRYPAFAIYPYDYRETIETIETSFVPDIPDDEIWVYAEGYSSIQVETHQYNRSVINTTNEYDCFVLKKGVHFSSDPNTNLHTAPLIAISFSKIVDADETVINVRSQKEGLLYALCGHRVVPVDNGRWQDNLLKVGDVEQTRITYTYVDPVLELPEDTSDNKFVTYTWANNKYVQLSSAIFDTSDLHLEDITDQVVSLTSTNAISNQAFCNALRYKVSIAEILENPAAGFDNPVASKGIKAAIDKLITWDDIDCIPITQDEIHSVFTVYAPITLEQANYYRIVIRGLKTEGANYLAKIFDKETLTGLTFVARSEDGPSISEELIFTEDTTGKRIPVVVSCANKYNSASQFYPGDLFDESTDGYYRADTSTNDMVITLDIKRKLSMTTLRKLAFTCMAGRPYQTMIPPTEKLYVSTYGSVGGVDYPSFRTDIVYTPDKVANDGVYLIPLFPAE